MKYVIIAVTAYLLGSFCASIPLSKRAYGDDVRSHGSGNAGATNVARVYGLKAGLITLACDVAKTVIAMLLGFYLGGELGKAIGGVFCITGHCFPLYFGFKGGKGVSVGVAIGMLTGLGEFAIIAVVFFATVFISRKVSLSSMLAAIMLPIATALLGESPEILAMNIFCAVIIVVMHRENIKRLINGTEPDFKPKKS